MPRPTPRTGPSVFAATPLMLSSSERKDLAAFLLCTGREPDGASLDRAIRDTEKWLGFYAPAVAATAAAPRASVRLGRPTNEVLMKVINELRRVFQRHYRIEKTGAARKASALEPWQQAEVDFVTTALDFAGIPHFDDVRRHFSAPGAALLCGGDREKQLAKIVAKVRADRSRSQGK